MPRIKTLPRRSFLRGIGGVAVALPALEIMSHGGSASAGGSAAPARFLTSFVGTTTGRRHYLDDECCGDTVGGDRMTPDAEGADYDLKQALQPLGSEPWQYETGFGGDQPAFDIQSEFTIVSGLKVPWGSGSSIPAGGRTTLFHGSTITPQLAGCICDGRGRPATTPTVDQLVAEVVGGQTLFESLAYRVEAHNYSSGTASSNANMAAMSWKRDGMGGVVRVDPVVHPGLAWETLFTGFVPPDPAAAAAAAFELRTRTSVLDLVGESASRLSAKLGRTDQIRMEQHLDEIRSLETRLASISPPSSPECQQVPDPGQEWPITPGGGSVENETNKWSNEELRAEVLADLVHMAFVCDLTRVASFMFEHWKSYLNMAPAIGRTEDLHDLTHFGGPNTGIGPQSDSLAWHMKHFARLARKLKDTPDPDGTPVLDRTVMTMIFEGGWGADPEAGGIGPHSTENMIVMVAGGRALGLNPGRHINGGNDVHPASVLLAAAQACGVTEPLGDIDTPLAGL